MDSIRHGTRSRSATRFLLPLVLAGAAVGAGCSHTPRTGIGGPDVQPEYIQRMSILELAGQLNMQVSRSSTASAVLRDTQNTVVVFGDPDGSIRVNNRPLTRRGGIISAEGVLLVPVEYGVAIRSRLRPVRAQVPRETAKPIPGPLGTVVLDPGHGGDKPGAVYAIQPGLPKIHEKWINLNVAGQVALALRQDGIKVVMTRSQDVDVENSDRAALANKLGADLFVSTHANAAAAGDSSLSGYEIYVHTNASAESRAAAEAIAAQMDAAGLDRNGSARYRRKNLLVLRETTGPAVLVEVGYMSNPGELRKMTSSSYQKRVAAAIAAGIVKHLQAHRSGD